MAEASVREQSGAGLDRCSPDELEAFRRLNAAYLARFGFPFIIAVAASRGDILAAFADRLENDPRPSSLPPSRRFIVSRVSASRPFSTG